MAPSINNIIDGFQFVLGGVSRVEQVEINSTVSITNSLGPLGCFS